MEYPSGLAASRMVVPVPAAMRVGMPSCGRPRWAAPVTHTKRTKRRRFAHSQIARPLTVGRAAPNGRPECAGSRVTLTAEMDAPVAANGHAAEIDILLGVLSSKPPSPAGCPIRHHLFQGRRRARLGLSGSREEQADRPGT